MSSNVTRITQALGFSLMIVVFGAGCGNSGNTNSPTGTPSVGTVEKQKVSLGKSENLTPNNSPNPTTDASASTPKTLTAESMISASQLDEGIKAKKNWQIIDVREPSEFATGHVPQAINIPLGSVEAQITKIAKDRDVILICHTGVRAFTAWQTLVRKGYDLQHLKVLVGGMEQWKSLGSGEVTESIGGC
ncbi:MAG: hypothetical protein APF81_03370 [Desulfosporosinus sp. BRH_c37]|nr:MAG: hypothetical protein APF81_03370 [Desulfosporosinus sp. BRH_c37]